MPADAIRRATLTLRPAEGSAEAREACFTSLTMRRTYEGGYARPASSCQIDPKKVAGFWDEFHKIVAQRHAEGCVVDGAPWEVTWIDGNAKGQVGGVLPSDIPLVDLPDNRYEQRLALFEGLCR